MCSHSANKIFAVAGTGHRASLIVRVRAGADYRRVAYSPRQFVRRPAGRSRRSQVAVLIQGNGTHRAVPILIGDHKDLARAAGAMFFGSLNLLQSVPALLSEKILLIHQFNSVCLPECLRALTVEHEMRRFFHNESGKSDGILDML